MKAGDRVLIKIGDTQSMCDVVQSESKAVLMLVSDDGERVATVQQFWRKTEPVFGGEKIKHVETISNAYVSRICNAPGCGKVYQAKKADIARGWGMCCSKSCAARSRKK